MKRYWMDCDLRLKTAIKAVMQASKCIDDDRVKYRKGSLRDIVTKSDLLAENEIKSQLSFDYPLDTFIGEESYQSDETENYWICDPIDGTANFSSGQKYYCCALAYIENGMPIVSVVHAPKLNKIYWASLNLGAFVNSTILRPKSIPITEALIAVSIPAKASSKLFEKIEKLNENSRGVLRLGSANLNILQVCENTVGFAYGFSAPKWDIEPALAIAKISGVNFKLNQNENGTYNYIVTKGHIDHQIESFLYG
jgi:myo-inositol-1(or 4)-monophosphatase